MSVSSLIMLINPREILLMSSYFVRGETKKCFNQVNDMKMPLFNVYVSLFFKIHNLGDLKLAV